MGFLPDKLTNRDKFLAGLALLLLAGGAAAFFVTRDDSNQGIVVDQPSQATDPIAVPAQSGANPRDLKVEGEAAPTLPAGGPRVNPDYKPGGG